MRNKSPLFLVGVAMLIFGSFWIVPGCFGSTSDAPDIQTVLLELEGLEFEDFLDASYIQILLRSPELVTGMGLSDSLGTGDGRLDNICFDFVDETYQLKAGIQTILETYERSDLDYEQQISFDSYSWLLDDWAVEHEFMYHFYPVNHGISRQNDLFLLFEDESTDGDARKR